MKCKLCLVDKKLQRESHIIPQFMYKQLLRDEGYFHKVGGDTFKEFSLGKTPQEFKTGEYDRNILCADCENDVLCKRFEDYAAKVYQSIYSDKESLHNVKIDHYTNENGVDGKIIKDINYTKFKLFLLSILWRASISKKEFFNQVKLGNKHEEIIRKMIFDENPKQPDEYPCFIYDMSIDQPILKGTILLPRKIRESSNTSYEFMICGIAYRFTISKYGRKKIAIAGVINQDNSMIIWKAPVGLGKYYLEEFRKHYFKGS